MAQKHTISRRDTGTAARSALTMLGLWGVALVAGSATAVPAFARDDDKTGSAPTPVPSAPLSAPLPDVASGESAPPSYGAPPPTAPRELVSFRRLIPTSTAPGIPATGGINGSAFVSAASSAGAAVTGINNSGVEHVSDRPKKSGERLLGWIGRDLDITGNASIHGQGNSVSGSTAGLDFYRQTNVTNLNYQNVGPFQQNADLTINGRVLNAFTINARLSNQKYGNQFNKLFGVNYKSRGTTLDVGTVNASLPGNELVTFSRSLEGIQFSRDLDRKSTFRSLFSLTRGITRKGSFQGQGTSGPYSLNASQIVEGSEHVQLNGRDLDPGKDYRIDYVTGQITFQNGLLINQTDTVAFTYESQTYNTTPGILTGGRYEFRGTSGLAYGMTYVTQRASGGASKNGNVTERFAVIGVAGSAGGVADPTYKYYLSSLIDQTKPVVVKYADRTLIAGTDYSINLDLRYVQLIAALPADTADTASSSLTIEYHPIRQNGVTGNRSVMGLDSTVRVAKNGIVAFNFGSSKSETGEQNGTGLTLSSTWHSLKEGNNAWTTSIGLRDIGEGFSNIDSTSAAFQQAQKGLTASFNLRPNEFYSINTALTQSKIATQSLTSGLSSTSLTGTTTTAPPTWVSNQNLDTSLDVHVPRLPTMQLKHTGTTQGSSSASGTRSTFSSDALNLGWSKGIFSLSSSFSRNQSHGASVFSSYYNSSVASSTTATSTTLLGQVQTGQYTQSYSDSTATTSRFSLGVHPAEWFNVTGDLGFSRNRNGSGSDSSTSISSTSSNARDNSLTLFLRPEFIKPLSKMTLTSTLSDTSNGQNTSAYYSGTSTTGTTATGTATNGSILGGLVTGQRTRSATYSIDYTPSGFFTLNFTRSSQLSLVPGLDNTQTGLTTVAAFVKPFRLLQFNISSTQSRTTTVNGQGDSNNRSVILDSLMGPFGKISLRSTLTRSNYDSATYSTASTGSYVGSTGSAFSGADLGTGLGTSTVGYVQQGTTTNLDMTTSYNVGGNKSLFFKWSTYDQASPLSGTTTTGTTTVVSGSAGAASIHSPINYKRGTGSVGFEMPLQNFLRFTAAFNLLNLRDRDDPKYSYHAHTVTADLSAHF